MPSKKKTKKTPKKRAHLCGGCVTLPTTGFDSKPPNADGYYHWCDDSRALAVKQELARDPSWGVAIRAAMTPEWIESAARYLKKHSKLRVVRGGV